MGDFAFRRDPSQGGVIGPRQGTDQDNVHEVARGTKPLAYVTDRNVKVPEGLKVTPVSPHKKDEGKVLVHKEEDSYRARAFQRAYKGMLQDKKSSHARIGIALGYHNDDIRAMIKDD